MRITKFWVSNLRIFSEAELTPSPHLNLIVGPNASGKTSLLEGIHLLAVARSFRTPRISEVIRRGSERMAVRGEVEKGDDHVVELKVEKGRHYTRLRAGGKRLKSTSELATHLPVVAITPDSHNILHGGPRERRRLLDWALFHVEHGYLAAWHSYQRALRQRNRLLRQGGEIAEIAAWEAEMAQFARLVHTARRDCVAQLAVPFAAWTESLGLKHLSLRYSPGWDQELELAATLRARRVEDMTAGTTRVGPHRADIRISQETVGAAASVSRGQSKLVVAALLAANVTWLGIQKRIQPVLLVDDFGAELDARSRAQLGELIAALGIQTFVTTTSLDQLPNGTKWRGLSSQMFHVKQGAVQPEMV